LKFTLKRAATDYDIPLASITIAELKAADLIQLYDYGPQLNGNPIAAFRFMETFPDGTNPEAAMRYRLVSDNLFGKVLLTDEFNYEKAFGTRIPLWFAHPLRQAYFNPNSLAREVKKKVRVDHVQSDRILPSLIPAKGSYVIVSDSVTVSVKELLSSPYVTLPRDSFHIDYARGTIAVKSEAMYGLDGPIYEYKVNYTLVPIDIRIQTTESVVYRIELIPIADGASEYYSVNILTDNDHMLFVVYRSQLGPGTIEDIQEYTTAIPLYTDVHDAVRLATILDTSLDIMARRVFSRVRAEQYDHLYVTSSNNEHIFAFKSRYIQPSKISVNKPYVGDFTRDWKPRVSASHVVNSTGEYEVVSKSGSLFVREIARVINSRTISLSGSDIIVRLLHTGGWDGVKVIRQVDGSSVGVQWVDARNGLVGLAQDISRRDEVIVEYCVRSNDMEIDDLCLNPMVHHDYHNNEIRTSAFVICILDRNLVPPERSHSLYFKKLPKDVGGRPATYTYELVSSWLNSSDEIVRNTYRAGMGLPSSCLGSRLIRVEPLALVRVANPLDQDAYELFDMRVFGGGYREWQPSFFDYSNYDGEGTDLESMLVIEVPTWIKENLAQRAQLWDPEVIKSDAPAPLANYKAEQLIKVKAEKFSMLGTTQEVIIGTKTPGHIT